MISSVGAAPMSSMISATGSSGATTSPTGIAGASPSSEVSGASKAENVDVKPTGGSKTDNPGLGSKDGPRSTMQEMSGMIAQQLMTPELSVSLNQEESSHEIGSRITQSSKQFRAYEAAEKLGEDIAITHAKMTSMMLLSI